MYIGPDQEERTRRERERRRETQRELEKVQSFETRICTCGCSRARSLSDMIGFEIKSCLVLCGSHKSLSIPRHDSTIFIFIFLGIVDPILVSLKIKICLSTWLDGVCSPRLHCCHEKSLIFILIFVLCFQGIFLDFIFIKCVHLFVKEP